MTVLQKVLNQMEEVDPQEPALVVLSGGQDSMTCLALALVLHHEVHAIGFDYGQKHSVELEGAIRVTAKNKVPFTTIPIGYLNGMVTSALFKDGGEVSEPHPRLKNLPASFVPNRNATFMTIAHAYAQEIGAQTIYTGVCQTDYSGYPDCRAVFIDAMEKALNIGYQQNIHIATPMMYLDKAQIFALADELGWIDTIVEESHTCYNGDHTTKHEWGYGCGACPACQLRMAGYAEYLEGEYDA